MFEKVVIKLLDTGFWELSIYNLASDEYYYQVRVFESDKEAVDYLYKLVLGE